MSLADEYEELGPDLSLRLRLGDLAEALQTVIAKEQQKIKEKIQRIQLLQQKITMGQTNLTYEYGILKDEILREQRLLRLLMDDVSEVNATIDALYARRYQKFPLSYRTWVDLVMAIETHTRALKLGMTEQDYMAIRPRFRNLLGVLRTL
jgi:hypothetical protein